MSPWIPKGEVLNHDDRMSGEVKPVIRFTRNWLKEPVPVKKDFHRANGFLEEAVRMLRPVIDEKKKARTQKQQPP